MKKKLSNVLTVFVMVVLSMVVYSLYQERENITNGLMQYATLIGIILKDALIAGAIVVGIAALVYVARFALPLIEQVANIRLRTHREHADILLRQQISEYAQDNRMPIKFQDVHVTHLPRATPHGDTLPIVRVIPQDTLPRVTPLALPSPAHSLTRPTINELTREVAANSFKVGLGRITETGKPFFVDIRGKHIKIIGASQMGKSCLAGAILAQVCKTHSPKQIQLAILDVEDMTGQLFSEEKHIASMKIDGETIKLHARNAEQVAEYLIYLHELMLYRYEQASQHGWQAIERLPYMLIYFEEFLYWKRTLAQFVSDKQTREQALAAITGIATRGLKVRMQLLISAQVDYADTELKDAMAQFVGINVSFVVKPSAARAAGFVASELLKQNFEAKTPGQYVVETVSGSFIGIAPDFDIKAQLKQLHGDALPVVYDASEVEIIDVPQVVPVQEQSQRSSLHGKLLDVYQASQELGTLNNRQIAEHTGLSASMVYRLIQQLRERGYV